MHHQNLQHILCSDTHEGGNFFLKKVQNPRWRHVYVEIQDGRYFSKIAYVFTDPQMYRFFESIKNLQRFDFLNICNSRVECAPPPKKSNGGLFCHPSKSKWEVPRNNPHHLAKRLHAFVNHNYKMHGQSPLLYC